MHAHPDADAFVRAILRDPADVATRLVFADWLEETGDASNVAWAQFIRLNAEAEKQPQGTPERRELQHQALALARQITAATSIPAADFVRRPRSFLQFLPPEKVRVSLDDFTPTTLALARLPEGYARENLVFPLDYQPDCLLVATPETHQYSRPRTWLFSLTIGRLVAVHATPEAILAAIERSSPFPRDDGGSTLNRMWGGPTAQGGVLVFGQAGQRGERYLEKILHQAASLRVPRVIMLPERGAVTVLYWGEGQRLTHPPLSHREMEWVAEAVFRVLGLVRSEYYGTQLSGRFSYDDHGLRHAIKVSIQIADDGLHTSFNFDEEVEILD